jgi:2-keto-4-pentenoate hydratase/2-oxohepta-3-ene-1,7-dioic acid hydratase in catechol pathway
LPERTLILSGTPSGTIFQGITLRQKLSGLGSWLWGGWSRSVPDHVIDLYVREAHAAGVYLRVGDRVTVHADFMGVIDNSIVAQEEASR